MIISVQCGDQRDWWSCDRCPVDRSWWKQLKGERLRAVWNVGRFGKEIPMAFRVLIDWPRRYVPLRWLNITVVKTFLDCIYLNAKLEKLSNSQLCNTRNLQFVLFIGNVYTYMLRLFFSSSLFFCLLVCKPDGIKAQTIRDTWMLSSQEL